VIKFNPIIVFRAFYIHEPLVSEAKLIFTHSIIN